jgi:hypothetical protein
MLAIYLAALGFGTTMILVSLLLGGGDKDFDKDLHVDHDHDPGGHDHDHAEHDKPGIGFSTWWLLSLRFWTFGLATFGLAGTLLTFLPVPYTLTAVVSVLTGLLIGVGAARLFRYLNRDQVSGTTDLHGYVGEEARVLVPIRPGASGKIVLSSLAGRVEMLATTRDSDTLDVGTTVIVAGVSAGVADVSRLPVLGDDVRRSRAKAAVRGTGSVEHE